MAVAGHRWVQENDVLYLEVDKSCWNWNQQRRGPSFLVQTLVLPWPLAVLSDSPRPPSRDWVEIPTVGEATTVSLSNTAASSAFQIRSAFSVLVPFWNGLHCIPCTRNQSAQYGTRHDFPGYHRNTVFGVWGAATPRGKLNGISCIRNIPRCRLRAHSSLLAANPDHSFATWWHLVRNYRPLPVPERELATARKKAPRWCLEAVLRVPLKQSETNNVQYNPKL